MHVVSGPELSLLFSPCFFLPCCNLFSWGITRPSFRVHAHLSRSRYCIQLSYVRAQSHCFDILQKSPFSCRIPFNRHFDYTRPSVSRTFLRLPDLPTHRLYLRKCSFPLCELRNGRQTTTPRSTVPVPYKPIRAESVVHSPTKSSCATS